MPFSYTWFKYIFLYPFYYTTEVDMTLHFIYKLLASLKKIYTQNYFLFFSFHFNFMVSITAAVLASTLVNGLQHNQIHVIKTYFKKKTRL